MYTWCTGILMTGKSRKVQKVQKYMLLPTVASQQCVKCVFCVACMVLCFSSVVVAVVAATNRLTLQARSFCF